VTIVVVQRGHQRQSLAAEGHDSLADSTNGTAWSDVPPSPLNARTLADEIETALGERQT